MTSAVELIEQIEANGGALALRGDRIAYEVPEEMAPLLEQLRPYRDEVLEILRERQEVPAMPPGIALISWNLKEPPVAIESCSVVINPALFAKHTLSQLQAALTCKRWPAGHWSTAELIQRLKQVGVEVELNIAETHLVPGEEG